MHIERPHFENERGGERLVERQKEHRLQRPAGCAQRAAVGILAVGLTLGWLAGLASPVLLLIVVPISILMAKVVLDPNHNRRLGCLVWIFGFFTLFGLFIAAYVLGLLRTVRPLLLPDYILFLVLFGVGLVIAGFNYAMAWLLRRERLRSKNPESMAFAIPVEAAYPELSSPPITHGDNTHHAENNDATA